MEDGGWADLEEDVPHALLGHVERLRRVEDALVERHQTADVLRQKRHWCTPSTSFTRSFLYTTNRIDVPPNVLVPIRYET
jgi:hypothetical protein